MTSKRKIEMLRNRWAEKIESNAPQYFPIVPRQSQPCSNEKYYEGVAFKESWDVTKAIQDRVNREDVTFEIN